MKRRAAPLIALLFSPTVVLAQDDEEQPRPRDAVSIARELGVSDDDRRPDDQMRIQVLGHDMIVGGEAELSTGLESGYALARGEDDSRLTIEPEIKFESIWLLEDDLVTFTEVKAFGEADLWREGGGADSETGVELGEAWLLKTNIAGTPLALQVGRQQLQDRREWWWDEDLDMVRLHYFGDRVTAFAGLGRDLAHYSTVGRREPDERGIVRKVVSLKWDWAERQEVQVFALDQRDTSASYQIGQVLEEQEVDFADLDATWLGVRVRGRVRPAFPGKIYYWGDFARVRGSEITYETVLGANNSQVVSASARNRVRGWAYDVGASFELPTEFDSYLTLGHARGSGGATPFRQTGIHGNNGKFRGNSRFRYYGELLRPDLSNLKILTTALGLEPVEDGWLELVWHRYTQVTADTLIEGSRLDVDPNGVSRRLGQELDLIASYRPPSGWDFELSAGVFKAGPAFGPLQGSTAVSIEVKASRNF